MARVPPFRKTPLTAAFFCAAALLAGCQSAGRLAELPPGACEEPGTRIATIQGDGRTSPLTGQTVMVRGVVTLKPDAAGLFLEERMSDASHATSNGLYVASEALARAAGIGDQLAVAGNVIELGEADDTLTSLDAVTGYRVCEEDIPLPVSDARLPMSPEEKEALEGMNILLRQSMAISDVYGLRQGRVRLSVNGILPIPTEVARPGRDARDQARRNRNRSFHAFLHEADRQPYAVGATVMAASGVLGHDGRGPRLLLREPLASMPKPLYRIDPPAGDDLRVLGLNLHNYFNGNGRGGGFPAPRGAASETEFEDQRERFTALVRHVEPHLVGVMELENDGFGPRSAASDFIRDLEGAGQGSWAVATPRSDRIGSDQITVGIFYRTDMVKPAGQAMLLSDPPFDVRSRVPIAQWFVHQASGAAFLVVVNHFKSKGSCPEDQGPDSNLRDGQGCWNRTRLESARRLAGWINRMLDNSVSRNALILGDMNAYRMEDPIRAIVEAGFKDLTVSGALQFEYSFVYRGEAGSLDYAFASPALLPAVRTARYLNVNAAYPPGVALEHPWLRSSDHDPVMVDLRFRQPATAD